MKQIYPVNYDSTKYDLQIVVYDLLIGGKMVRWRSKGLGVRKDVL